MTFPRALRWLALLILFMSVVAGPLPVQAGSGPHGDVAAPTRLVIPKIRVDTVIEPVGLHAVGDGFEWGTLWDKVGWHNLSATPGHMGNTVLSGHNNSRGTRVFKDLWKLKIGDQFTVYVGSEPHLYEVTDRVTFRQLLTTQSQRDYNRRWIEQFPDERVTLVTCHPTWTDIGRLIIVGKPVTTRP